MNEQHSDIQPVDLPKPVQEQAETPVAFGAAEYEASEQARSQAVESGQSVAAPQPANVSQQPQADPTPPQSAALGDAPAGQPQASSTPLIADDVDLIEKEWVHKAKQIVEHTKDDPYNQNKQMNAMKADYLKKRYNKDMKQAED